MKSKQKRKWWRFVLIGGLLVVIVSYLLVAANMPQLLEVQKQANAKAGR